MHTALEGRAFLYLERQKLNLKIAPSVAMTC